MRKVCNIPNLLTILRFILSPLFYYLLVRHRIVGAFILFLTVAATDLFDGWVARKTNNETKFGEALDPFADKFMVGLGVIALVKEFDFPTTLIPLFLARDIVSILGSILYFFAKHGNWKPNIFGKLTTFMQVITIGFYILGFKYKVVLFIVTAVFSMLTAVTYLNRGIRFLIEGKQGERIPLMR
jgi:cardiolipin synthase